MSRKFGNIFQFLHPLTTIMPLLKPGFMIPGFILLSLVFSLNQVHISDYFPIKTVQVIGANKLDPQEVQTLVLPLVQRGYFTVDVERIRNRLYQLQWISDLAVRRVWPDKIEINIIEKNPVAYWNGSSLLSTNGEVFSSLPRQIPENLPTIVGPPGKQMQILKYFKEMNRLLLPLHAKISYLEMTPYFSWKLTLDNGIKLQIGHKDILTRLDHFVKVYPKIVGKHAADVDYIDLRYANGMAVRWKEKKITV